jgi:molecular chaperone DnaK
MKIHYKDRLSEEDAKKIDETVTAAKGKAELTDKDELEKTLKDLNEAIMPIGAKMYESAQADQKETPAEGEPKSEEDKKADSEKKDDKKDKDQPVEGEVVDDKKDS